MLLTLSNVCADMRKVENHPYGTSDQIEMSAIFAFKNLKMHIIHKQIQSYYVKLWTSTPR